MRSCSTSPNPQPGGPLLVGFPRLFIQYVRRYPPHLEAVPATASWGGTARFSGCVCNERSKNIYRRIVSSARCVANTVSEAFVCVLNASLKSLEPSENPEVFSLQVITMSAKLITISNTAEVCARCSHVL